MLAKCIAYGLFGIIYGFVMVDAYCKKTDDNKKVDKKKVEFKWATVGSTSGIVAFIAALEKLFLKSGDAIAIQISCFLGCSIVTFTIASILVVRSYQHVFIEGKPISFIHVFMNIAPKLTEYAEQYEMNFVMKKQELEEKEIQLNNRSVLLEKQQHMYLSNKKELDDAMGHELHYHIPVNQKQLIDQRTVQNLKTYVDNFSNYITLMDQITDKTINYIESEQYILENFELKDVVKGFFLHLSCITSEHLFNANRGIRTHFRYLDVDTYRHYTAYEKDCEDINAEVKAIGENEGLIKCSLDNKSAILKSKNLECAISGTHDHMYKDYLTITFDEIKKENKCILTMGISVRSSSQYTDFLCFINHMDIDKNIQRYLLKLKDHCDIVKYILEGSAKNGN